MTGAYLISRGLSKSGSRDPYWEDSGQNRARDGAGDASARERITSQ